MVTGREAVPRSAHAQAVTLLQHLWLGGVRDVVLSPGSRSTPLALALHAADSAGDLRLHVRIDERSAAFLALGLATGSRRPVAVVTTSGTAVGNLLPAVMEAHHTGRALIVVSADRPDRLRGTGANQTTVQAGIFGHFAPCHDLAPTASAESIATAADSACTSVGPTQLNLQLDGRLVPADADPLTWWTRPDPQPDHRNFAPADLQRPTQLALGPRTVVVAGDDAGPAARLLAEAANWPLFAEPTSGARIGRQAIRAYRLLLGTPLRAEIERVVVIGHPTLSRPITSLISDPALEVISVRDRTGMATDPGRVARVVDLVPTVAGAPLDHSTEAQLTAVGPSTEAQPTPARPSTEAHPAPAANSPGGPDWFERWRRADEGLCARIDGHVAATPGTPLAIAAVVAAAVTARTTLVLGSSNAVRDLDVMAQPWAPHEHRFVVGNRGLAGIDGFVSTAMGIALGRPGASRTICYLGDVTLLHDTNGLLIGPDEPRPDLTFVVLNDDGGAIFSGLEQGASEYARAFERVFGTPHHTDLAAMCKAHGIDHERITRPERLEAALRSQPSGIRLIEVPVSRTDRRAENLALRALAESS